MIVKTKVTNNFDHSRKLRWAGKSGISIGPRETKELEGFYPSACNKEWKRRLFNRDYKRGYFKAVLVTDMSVNRCKQPEEIKKNIDYVIKNQPQPN